MKQASTKRMQNKTKQVQNQNKTKDKHVRNQN